MDRKSRGILWVYGGERLSLVGLFGSNRILDTAQHVMSKFEGVR